ncbi:MAG TPA: hypothetical protein VEB03_01310 [Candidatus Nanoarchaeia archaeon]|nr:hypothetical protein [Candidatus Nanoarchaeia archaeon]
MTRVRLSFLTFIGFTLAFAMGSQVAFAGGPLYVAGPIGGGNEGKALKWNISGGPIEYRVDPGPMSVNPSGTTIISNAAGLQRVNAMFAHWTQVPTALLNFANAGALQPTGLYTGGDVSTAQQYNALLSDCDSGTQNPVIFDANGSLTAELGMGNSVIGFAGVCGFDMAAGRIKSAHIVMNGKWQDGMQTSSNGELENAEFDEAITHEIGHFIGLDHSQINADVENTQQCPADLIAGLPLMYPYSACAAKQSYGLPMLAPDDLAWVSDAYPKQTEFNANYGKISGYILFSDGVTHVQGANVIARAVDNPATPEDESRRVAVSAVSGYLFAGNLGQTVTATYLLCSPPNQCPPNGYYGDNRTGSIFGSRKPITIGYYEIPVPSGTYTIEIESVAGKDSGEAYAGPLTPPILLPGSGAEFWNDYETPFDDPATKTPITVAPGQSVTGVNIILNNTPPRYDQYEDNGAELRAPALRFIEAAAERRNG